MELKFGKTDNMGNNCPIFRVKLEWNDIIFFAYIVIIVSVRRKEYE